MDINIFQTQKKTELEELLDSKVLWKEQPLYYIEAKQVRSGNFEHPMDRYDVSKYHEYQILLTNECYFNPEHDGSTKFVLFRKLWHQDRQTTYYFVLSNVKPKIKEDDGVMDFVTSPDTQFSKGRNYLSQISFLNDIFFSNTPNQFSI